MKGYPDEDENITSLAKEYMNKRTQEENIRNTIRRIHKIRKYGGE